MARGDVEQRAILEWLGNALDRGLETALGGPVQAGLRKQFDETDMERRPLPIRAVLVEFSDGYLKDVVLAISNMDTPRLASYVSTVAMSIGSQLEVDCEISQPQPFEFDDREEANEQLEALFGSDSVRFDTPDGSVLIAMGTGFVDSAGDVLVRSGKLRELIGKDAPPMEGEPAMPHIEDDFAAEWSPDDSELITATNVPDMDAEFSAVIGANEEAAAQPEVTPFAPPPLVAPVAPVVVAQSDRFGPQSDQWSELLTDVEVQLSAEFGSTEMRLGELSGLHGDTVLTFDQIVDEPITVFVNGSPYAKAKLVVIEDEYGIEIVEVLDPAQDPDAIGVIQNSF
jgi:flagellar motor switch protein FliN/FliY